MGLFNRKKQANKLPLDIPTGTPIEIVTNKNARQEVIEQSKRAQHELNKLLEENHFTIKIMVAAGAKPRSNKKKA